MGRARQVRIWDEAILPASPICVNVTLIEAMTHIFRKHNKKLLDEIDGLIAMVKRAKDKEFVEVPAFEEMYGVDTNDVLALFHDQKRQIRDAANDLWLISGKAASVRSEGDNNTVLDYEETWPSDLLPILVLDASGRVRHTYRLWDKHIGNLVVLKGASKDYSNLTVHIWRRGGGKQCWKDNGTQLIDGIVSTIRSLPDPECLVVHHKCGPSLPVDVPSRVVKALGHDWPVNFLNWGNHSATNEYCDVPNVILAGTLFYEPSYYEALARGSRKLKQGELLSPDDFDGIRAGEHAHLILQAACRGRVRKSVDGGCPQSHLYIIAHPRHGISSLLEDGTIFHGCKTVDWSPVPRKLTGKVKKALDYLIRDDRTTISFSNVSHHLGMSRTDFYNDVFCHPDFEGALAECDIRVRKGRGRAGNAFIKKGSVTA